MLVSALVIRDHVGHIHDNWNRATDLLGDPCASSPLQKPEIFVLFAFIILLALVYGSLFVISLQAVGGF